MLLKRIFWIQQLLLLLLLLLVESAQALAPTGRLARLPRRPTGHSVSLELGRQLAPPVCAPPLPAFQMINLLLPPPLAMIFLRHRLLLAEGVIIFVL